MPEKSPIAPELQHLAVPMHELALWPGNPRVGDIGALAESLKRFGQVRPILVQKSTMQVVAGNHLYRAAVALGWTEIAAVVMDLSAKQAKAYVASDNRISELGGFDEEALALMLAEIHREDGLAGTGYDLADLEALLAKVNAQGRGFGKGDPDATKAPPEEPWVKEGMIFQLGDHRIVCGDGTDPTVIEALVGHANIDLLLVQPPAKGKQNPLDLRVPWQHVSEQLWFSPERYDLLRVSEGGSFLIWDKRTENTTREFAESFELIYSTAPHQQVIYRHTFVGAADGESYGGPDFNERPTALFMDLFEKYSGWNAAILDPIALGATPLLAAEKLGRRWFGAKSDPALVQATIEKWEEYTGFAPQHIADVGGAG